MSSGEKTKKSGGSRFMILLAAFVVIVAGMRASSSLLVPFLFSLFLAIIFLSPFLWLLRKGVPQALSLLIVILGIILIAMLMGSLIGTSVNDFSENLPLYEKNLNGKITLILGWLGDIGINLPNQQQLLDSFDLKEPLRWIGSIVRAFGAIISQTFLIIITVVFLLLELSLFPEKLMRATKSAESGLIQFRKIHDNIKQYVSLKTMVSLVTGFLVTIWLLILGIDYPILWGLLAFLLNFVPNIGSIIAAIPTVLLALIQIGPLAALFVALGYLVINFLIGNIIEPKLMGHGLGLSTLVVFLSLVFWGWVLGPVGMLLSVPLTMVLKIALDSHEETRWAAVLLGSETKTK
jgi:predicted PurR-regulated permease PerM